MANKKENKPISMDKRIKNALDQGPLAALYFVVGIDMLKERIDALDDDALIQMFERMLAPDRVRSNIAQIYQMIHPQQDEHQK